MPFIGQQPTTGTFLELDSLTASATADYTLQLNGANYEPESVNNLLVSINGVIQGSNTMSLSGSTLTVGATLSSSDVIDFVRVFGNVGTISTPTDGSVTTNKIGANAVTSAKMFSGFVNGITEFDIFHQTTNLGSDVSSGTYLTSDISRFAGNGFQKIGTGMSFSSGVFTFPSTGQYYVYGKGSMQARSGAVTQAIFRLDVTLDNSSYTEIARGEGSAHTADATFPLDCHSLINVTDTSNVKVKFLISTSTNACRTLGVSGILRTHFVFMKIGA